jgi:hypothetical protein
MYASQESRIKYEWSSALNYNMLFVTTKCDEYTVLMPPIIRRIADGMFSTANVVDIMSNVIVTSRIFGAPVAELICFACAPV